jgi:hypothetical protein
LTEAENVFVNISVDEDCSLDIFEQTTNTSEPTKELVNKEMIPSVCEGNKVSFPMVAKT